MSPLTRSLHKLPANFLASEIDGELILIHGHTGRFFSLKESGLQIWTMLDAHPRLGRLCDELVREYAVEPAACAAEVVSFADELVDAGLAEYA